MAGVPPSATSKSAAQSLLREIGPGQRNRRRRHIDPGDVGAALGEARQIDACPASDFEHLAPRQPSKSTRRSRW